jgi:hypothetical protein
MIIIQLSYHELVMHYALSSHLFKPTFYLLLFGYVKQRFPNVLMKKLQIHRTTLALGQKGGF